MSMTEFALMTLIFQTGIEIWYFTKCLEWNIKKIEFYKKHSVFLSKIEDEMDKQYQNSLIIYGLNEKKQKYIRYYNIIIENNRKGE